MKNSGRKYMGTIIAALVALAAFFGYFVYSEVKLTPADLEVSESGMPTLEPGGGAVPSGPPDDIEPPSSPPGN
ncbi:MAG: hypothetical protein V1679_01525 [Candidatus Peregrinibacteria bacterium]